MNAMQEPTGGREGNAAPGYAGPPSGPQAPSAPMPGRDPRSKSPALAAVLSMMPGLGQVYLGYYQRGFVNALVIAGIITLMYNVDVPYPLTPMFMAFFWLYNIIDAARRATLYNEALAGRSSIDLPQDFKMPGLQGTFAGGFVLIVVGFILLLNTRFGVSLDWLEEWWPAAPILFGAYLLYRAIQDRRASESAE